ncbi:cell wall metabolism sensor histidine kinase WalK [Amnibacterium sp.]|uniref:sensor histidine kinase n=1 Tax=Amnibacterium sp. TaxID=1872496 RepID=UPI00260914FB|nr:HAMP domain-containing sensor histidine kinase [Amnibacterium sp.]MCU1472860.1 sensor histidine kinase [Amnibacterium sp.]
MHASLAEWWNAISLRTKITAVTVLVMTVGLVVSGFGTMTVLRNYLIRDADTQISQTLNHLSASTATADEAAVATQYVYAHVDASGNVIDRNPQWRANAPVMPRVDAAFLQKQGTSAFTVKNDAGAATFRMEVRRLPDGTAVALGLPLDTVNRLIAQLFTLFFVFGIVVVLLGAVVTRLLVGSTFGPLRQVERTAAAIADGDFGQRLGNTTPNTEVGRLNRSLNRMLNRIDGALADRARTIEQMRRFVGDASHELRTPLVSVRGYAELYRMGALQSREDIAQAMDRIEREAVRLGALVTDLLALARLDESRELKRTPVELLPLAHDAALDARALAPKRMIRVIAHDPEMPTGAIEILRPVISQDESEAALTTAARLFRRNGAPADSSITGSIRLASARLLRARRRADEQADDEARVTSSISGSVRPVVLAEEDKLRQVLTNLIGNAIRFTPDDSPIEIATYVDRVRSRAVLEIIDHGDGIPPQIRDKIFQRFWRADSSRTRDTGGAGLGLAIVAAIVNAHGGDIGISETPGGGATFRVTLPLLPTQDDEPEVEVDEDSDQDAAVA